MMKTFPDSADLFSGELFSMTNESGVDIPVDESSFEKLMQIVESNENVRFRSIELVYVDEEEILRINNEYLNHNYVTDIITFGYGEESEPIEGTLFCCAPRIEEQSREFDTSPADEFLRVFVHGLIHLAGYNDETEPEKAVMTRLENRYLELLGKET
ncbi:MAG: rRNA maturation RNase YbeY [Balneolaceae bacterium]|nr:rRNA maturation RNase YbeY [Balneolaceae bacterium]